MKRDKLNLTERNEDVMDRLPPFAWVVHPSEKTVVRVKRGIMGYYPAPKLPPGENPQAFADEMNKRDGVTKCQAEAMLNGSLFGFHVPGADPAYLEADAKKRAGKR